MELVTTRFSAPTSSPAALRATKSSNLRQRADFASQDDTRADAVLGPDFSVEIAASSE